MEEEKEIISKNPKIIERIIIVIGCLLSLFFLVKLIKGDSLCIPFYLGGEVCYFSDWDIPLIISSLSFALFGYYRLKEKRLAAILAMIISLGIFAFLIIFTFLGYNP